MLTEFFFKLREGGVPVTIKEFLTLLEALRSRLTGGSLDEFYYLARVCLVKDESHFDRYDRVFAAYFRGVTALPGDLLASIPEEWLRRQAELLLTEEEKALIRSLGGWEKLMETLRQRLEEQRGRHQVAGTHQPNAEIEGPGHAFFSGFLDDLNISSMRSVTT